MPRQPKMLGRGNNGAVLGDSRQVYKWTVDPVELKANLALLALRNRGNAVRGFPLVHDVRIGDREGVIVREHVKPLSSRMGRRSLGPWTTQDLAQAGRYGTAASLLRAEKPRLARELQRRAAEYRARALSAPILRSVRDSLRQFDGSGLAVPDLRPENLAYAAGRRDTILAHDLGRTPLATLAASRGEAWQRCPNDAKVRSAVQRVLGTAPSFGACRIVGDSELTQVMLAHNWKLPEIKQTIGFHTEPFCNGRNCSPGDILLRAGEGLGVMLHEFVHAAKVVDKTLGVWLLEGITEAVAQEIAHREGIPHTPTYPAEVAFVRGQLAPALGVDTVGLGQMVIESKNRAGYALATHLSTLYGGTIQSWFDVCGPRSPDSEKLGQRLRRAQRV